MKPIAAAVAPGRAGGLAEVAVAKSHTDHRQRQRHHEPPTNIESPITAPKTTTRIDPASLLRETHAQPLHNRSRVTDHGPTGGGV